MTTRPRHRRFAAWLALAGLLLQFGLAAAHAARHFDHLVGPLADARAALAAEEPHRTAPDHPSSPDDRQRCAVDFCLAAAGHGVLAKPTFIPLSVSFDIARLDVPSQAIIPADRRHNQPPARAPPVIEIAA